jgi:hypothetical protein
MLIPRQFCAALALVAACAPATTSTSAPVLASSAAGSEARAAQPSSSGGRNVILAAEITAANLEGLTASDVVRRLRPHMLQSRADAGALVVFISGAEGGGSEILRTISARNVARIEFMSGVEATSRLPVNQRVGGAILVTLK